MVTSPLVASPSMSSGRSTTVPYLCSADKWSPLTSGSHASAAVALGFVYSFVEFCANFGKSYIELEVSKLSEPNFIGCLMKCSI